MIIYDYYKMVFEQIFKSLLSDSCTLKTFIESIASPLKAKP